MKKSLLLFAGSLLLATSVLAQRGKLTVDGLEREYVVYVPQNLGDNRPMLISCHGMNQDANYQKGMLVIESVADTAKFLTVFPEGIDKGWDIGGNRDINYVTALIDAMVDKYKIDRNRVYLSGFSMGGMFTYHAMNRIPDKIAAFAPISGYPMGGTTANANVRPIPIIHTHGTGDDVVNFGGVQGALNAWIKHNGCPTTAEVVKNYRGAPHITRHTWGPGNNNVEVVLMELKDKGHWISNDYGIKTGEEIWNFCKRYSLEIKDPSVRITAPTSPLKYITLGGTSQIPAITIRATASDPDGEVKSVAFYDGDELLAELATAPYNYELKELTKGTHTIRVVATDDEGRSSQARTTIEVLEPTTNYLLHGVFTTEGSVPDGWSAYDGKEKRNGFASGFSSGPRVFHFTGEKHDFEWGLYTRNVDGKAKAGYARFGDKTTTTTLIMHPGNYQLMMRVSNWNIATFSPVTMAVEEDNGQEVFSYTFTPTSNVGNTATNSFSGTTLEKVNFDITETGRYSITFYTADAPWADLVVGQAAIKRVGDITGISDATAGQNGTTPVVYDLQGRRLRLAPGAKGLFIVNGKKLMIRN